MLRLGRPLTRVVRAGARRARPRGRLAAGARRERARSPRRWRPRHASLGRGDRHRAPGRGRWPSCRRLAPCCSTSRRARSLAIAGDRLPAGYRRQLERLPVRSRRVQDRLGARRPDPVAGSADRCAPERCTSAGTMREVAASEDAVGRGRHADRPFVLLVQPTIADPSRAPAGKHVAWAYCHVPHGSTADMTAAIEAQVERFAPGFRDLRPRPEHQGRPGDGGLRRELRRRRHQRRRPGHAASCCSGPSCAGTRTRRRIAGCSCARRPRRPAAASTA